MGGSDWWLDRAEKPQSTHKVRTQEITALSKLRQKRLRRKPQLVRFGHREIETVGFDPGFWSDLYHRSMTVYWPVFFGSAAALFVTLNAVFGFLYSLGHEPNANAAGNGPLAYFYFSVETLATALATPWPPLGKVGGSFVASHNLNCGSYFLRVPRFTRSLRPPLQAASAALRGRAPLQPSC